MSNLRHEKKLRAEGCQIIVGIDEAGCGPLAGPVCVGAVVLPEKFRHPILNDSKQLTERQREKVYHDITANTRIRWHCEIVEVAEIDRLNILHASWLGMRRAVLSLDPRPDVALIDGRPVRDFPIRHVPLVDGDCLSHSIAAASVIAKVTRDRLMTALAQQYPAYGFEVHKGYATKRHLAALREHGPCPIHRRSFDPVLQMELPLYR